MKDMVIYEEKNSIFLSYDDKKVSLLNNKEFKNNLKNLKDVHKQENIFIDINNYISLHNFIFVNSMANYVKDLAIENNIDKILFHKSLKGNNEIIKLNENLNNVDIIGNIILCLVKSDEYLNEKIRIDYVDKFDDSGNLSKLSINEIINYIPNDLRELIEKLKVDLVAFNYVNQDDSNGSFTLPIYVDENKLIDKGIDYKNFLPNWTSVAYLKMLVQIHDFFADYYELDTEKGLVYDDLMLALIYLMKYEVKDYPQGLKKSIEVGRSTKGKCYFIDGIVTPIAINQKLAITLQGKDLFKKVTKLV